MKAKKGDDMDFSLDFTLDETPDGDFSERPTRSNEESPAVFSAYKTNTRHETRAALSERRLESTLDWHLQKGTTYHCISGGDVDALSYLRAIARTQPLDYVLISSWVIGKADVEEIASWKRRGFIKRLDFYVGEYFANGDRTSRMETYEAIKKLVEPDGRVCIYRNHAKITVGFGRDYDFSIASSANINTNPRIENTTITVDTGVATFYKEFYDGLKPYNSGYEGRTPWTKEAKE